VSDLYFTNATIINLWPTKVEFGNLHVTAGKIVGMGPDYEPDNLSDTTQKHDLKGDILIPGLVNGHTHLYSSLACGMPAPRSTPHTFQEILEKVWWRMDRALDQGSIEACGIAGALAAIRCGTTTVIDHHASPHFITESLDALSEAVESVGLRGVYCYETTDRHGAEGANYGIEENRRFCGAKQRITYDEKLGRHSAGVIGLHAPFTCGPETMASAAKVADRLHVPLHIHVAEDRCDRSITRDRTGKDLDEYLLEHQIARDGTLIAHGIHLRPEEIAALTEAGCYFAHQSRSNMNNQVGHAPLASIDKSRLMLGTDGIGSDMFVEGQMAYFKSQDGGTGLTPDDVLRALANNAEFAARHLGPTRMGQIEVGAPADLVRLKYRPATPLTAENFGWHFIFKMGSRHVRDVWIGGQQVLRAHQPVYCEKHPDGMHRLHEQTRRLWAKMEEL
jgi:cytosine/adenosine deaminase-related metal-dependent hydrolase